MRVATVMGVLLLGGAASLSAQHAHQFELGGFASYTRFDRAFLLDNQIGGGGRLGFWITDWLGIEGDGLYMRPKPTGGGSGTNFPVWFASGSLVLNFGSEKSFYLLGGYSAMDFNSGAAGGFRDAGAHAALGDRIYISDRAALRLEGRAYYTPSTQFPGSKWAGQMVGSAGLSLFLGSSRREKIYPEIPKQRRDSIVAAGGKVPEARPRGGPTYERRADRRAAGRGGQCGHEGVLLVDGRARHQAGPPRAVRSLHSDLIGGDLPDPGDHAHLPGWGPLLLRKRQRGDHGPAVSTRRKFSPRILRSASSL